MTDAPVHYRITPHDPHAHLFAVTCTIRRPDPAGQCVSLPAWIPGSYLIREFAKHVVALTAQIDGRALAVEKIDKSTWRCAAADGVLVVQYEVYAFDLSVRGAYLDAQRGFFNGTSVFVRVHGLETEACVVEIVPPAHSVRWRVATAMSADGAAPYGFGRYRADNYDELIDHPVELGEFALAEFSAAGVPHALVVSGRQCADMPRLTRDLARLCEHHVHFFGAPAPMPRYVFLVNAVGEGYGGLEHRASTSLICARDRLPRADEAAVTDHYREFLGLCSHEYFHTWNVKRIKPQAFAPYDLTRENYTRQLWAFEGITSYYDDLALVRTGLIDETSYLELLAQTITRVLRTPGRHRQSVADASFDAWTKFYRPDENAPNALVSYYAKGALVALALDLWLRRASEERHSLDTLMRLLWQRFGDGAGVPEGEIERLARELGGSAVAALLTEAVHGTDDLPLGELLAPYGIALIVRPADSDQDKGGKPAAPAVRARTGLDARFADGAEARLAHVFTGGAAQAAGLAAGDVVVAVAGIKATRANIDKLLNEHAVGARVTVHAFRRDELLTFEIALAAAAADTCELRIDPAAPALAQRRRAAWLGRAITSDITPGITPGIT